MTIKTHYGNVYGIETMAEAERILAMSEAELGHEGCPECRGTKTLGGCILDVRREMVSFSAKREDGRLAGNYTAREIALVARTDAWAALQPPPYDALADTATLFGCSR